MLPLLADENVSFAIVNGLRRAGIDIISAAEAGLLATPDDVILASVAERERVVLTCDRATMPPFAYERIGRGEAMIGMIVLNDSIGIGAAIERLSEIAIAREPRRLLNYIEYV